MNPDISSAMHCAVRVLCIDNPEGVRFLGSGYLLDSKHVVTCHHILTDEYGIKLTSNEIDETDLLVRTYDGASVARAKILGFDEKDDLALLELDKDILINVPRLVIKVSTRHKLEDYQYHSVGFIGTQDQEDGELPQELSLQLLFPIREYGILKHLRLEGEVAPGASGGPLLIEVNQAYYCIGIMTHTSCKQIYVTTSDNILKLLNKYNVQANNSIEARAILATSSWWALLYQPPNISWGVAALVTAFLIYYGVSKYFEQPRRVNLPLRPAITTECYKPPVSIPLGQCEPSMARKPFCQSTGFTLLLLRFSGIGAQQSPSNLLGHKVSLDVWTKLREFQRTESNRPEWLTANLTSHDLQVEFIPCKVERHEEARNIGLAWDADMVIWAEPYFFEDNKQQFAASITAVRWPGLDADSSPSSKATTNEIYRMKFPELTAGEPLKLLQFVLGLYAYNRQAYGLASSYFDNVDAENFFNTKDAATLLDFVGRSFFLVGEDARSIKFLEKARDRCGGDEQCLMLREAHLAESYERIRNETATLTSANRALSLATKLHDITVESRMRLLLGRRCQAQGNLTCAKPHYAQALSLANSSHDENNASCALIHLANVSKAEGHKEEAEEQYRQATQRAQSSGNLGTQSTAFVSAACNLASAGKADDAQRYLEDALRIQKPLGNQVDIAITLYQLGDVYFNKLNYLEAMRSYQAALNILEKTNKNDLTCYVHFQMATTATNQGNSPIAMHHYEKALPCYEGPQRAIIYNNLGVDYCNAGRYRDAIALYNKALLDKRAHNLFGDINLFMQRRALCHEQHGHEKEAYRDYHQVMLNYAGQGKKADTEQLLEDRFRIALQKNSRENSQQLIYDAQQFALRPEYILALEARRYMYFGDLQKARLTYSRLKRLAESAVISSKSIELAAYTAQAGIERLNKGGRLEGCIGMLVSSAENCQAGQEALQAGDVLLKYNNVCVNKNAYENDLWRLPKQFPPTKETTLHIWRGGNYLAIPWPICTGMQIFF